VGVRRNSSGTLATLAALRCASSLVSSFAAARGGSALFAVTQPGVLATGQRKGNPPCDTRLKRSKMCGNASTAIHRT